MNKHLKTSWGMLIMFSILILLLINVSAITQTGLQNYYKMDEPSGFVMTDSLNDSNGTIGTVTVNVPGKIDKGYDFNGLTNNVTIANEANFDFITANNADFTINYWTKGTNTGTPFFKGVWATDTYVYATTTTGAPTLWTGTNSSNYASYTADTATINGGSWYMVTWVSDAGTIKLYVNGVEDTLTIGGVGSYTGFNSANPVLLGENNIGGLDLTATIDEMSIWTRVLTLTDINELYNDGDGFTYPFISITPGFGWDINAPYSQINLLDSTIGQNLTVNDWNWLVDGATTGLDDPAAQNPVFSGAINGTDYNVSLCVSGTGIDTNTYTGCINQNVNARFFGAGQFNFYDDTNTILNAITYTVSPSINGVSAGTTTDNNLDLNLQGITTQDYTFTFSKTSYTTKTFDLTLNQYEDVNYDFAFIPTTDTTTVNFQVFTELGTTAPNTQFFAYDFELNKYIDIKTTDAVGRTSFNLDETKSDYNFFSTDFNFGTTVWTINKPKDATTLTDIAGDWNYSITGNSYSSGTNIASGITKLLLQNTTNPYYIKIQDANANYAPSNFGLQSVTSEKTKTLNPFLYPFGSASLVLIKLLDFTTNQPIAEFKELQLSLYTDSNGLIDIGTYINDSTGTYNIYMDANAKYQLTIDAQTFVLNPTLSVYYLYLTEGSGLDITDDVNTVVTPYIDFNSLLIMSQVREYFFGCPASEENCYPSMLFSLIFLVILAIGLSAYLTVGSLEQSILIIILLGMFTFMGFIPSWLFAITAVISFMWGVFS